MQINQNSTNDEIDIGLIYELHFTKIYKFFYYKVLSQEVAEDLTSQAFLTFADIVKKHKLIKDPNKIIYGIAKNLFMQYLKQKYRSEIPFSVIGHDFEDYVDKSVNEITSKVKLEDRALKYIEKLPEKQKDVIKLRLIEKLSLKEICTKLNRNMNYVKTTQKRGLKSLKILVETTL